MQKIMKNLSDIFINNKKFILNNLLLNYNKVLNKFLNFINYRKYYK